VLVQKIAARSGGKFSVSSKPGEGTTVQFAFPLAAN
jgi:signal transduction histidine kinase